MRSLPLILPAFNNVAVGGTATTRVPRNARYHAFFLQYKTNANQATIEADITEVRIKVNGKIIRQASAAQINIINAMNGIAFNAGMLPIIFSEPRRRTPEGEEYLALLAYEALGVGDVDIEVDISGAAAAPTLGGLMYFDYQRPADQFANADLRTVMHWMRKVTPCAAAFGASAPLTPPAFFPPVRGWLHRVHHFDPVVTQNILRNGQTPFWNATTVQLPALLGLSAMAKQANTFHAVLDATQQYGDGFPLFSAPDLAIDIVTSGAATGNQFVSLQEIRKALDLS